MHCRCVRSVACVPRGRASPGSTSRSDKERHRRLRIPRSEHRRWGVSSSTIGDMLAQDAALMTFASLMVVALVAMAESIRARCGLGVAFALLVCPLIPIYTSQSTRWRAVARHLPSSYISCGSVVGLPVYANGLDIRAIPGTTWELGLVTLFLFAIALLAIALFTDMARERTATKRLARRFS